MAWSVEFTDQFDEWWESLDESAQVAVGGIIGLLSELGPHLPFPRRVAVLLLGDDKGGSKRWYRKAVARADSVFDGHLEDLKGGG